MNLNEALKANPRPSYIEVEVTGIRIGEVGKPLVVRIPRPDRRQLAEKVGALAGPRPEASESKDEVDENAMALELGAKLIPAFATVEVEGQWIAPAFTFDTPPDPELLPGDDLTFVDMQKLTLAIMWMGGHGGGAAPESFLGVGGGSSSSS